MMTSSRRASQLILDTGPDELSNIPVSYDTELTLKTASVPDTQDTMSSQNNFAGGCVFFLFLHAFIQ